MAKQPGLEFQSAKSGMQELKRRLFFVIGALIVFRIGSYIPIPGVNTAVLAQLMDQSSGTMLDMFNMFSGGAMSRASIFTLGILPYISASIIVQLLGAIVPSLAELKKEGESGKKKLTQYTRFGTLILATIQAVGISVGLPNMINGLVLNPGFSFYFTSVISLVTGTMFLMWLGEQITERGVGNGISILIFAGIVAGFPPAIAQILEMAREDSSNIILVLGVGILVLAVTYFVVFIERGQRRIVVNYAKRQEGRRVYQSQTTHLPLKINMAGVLPAIFATSIILFPATISTWLGSSANFGWLQYISLALAQGKPLYIILLASAIIFFCFFYTALMFNPREIAENLKKSGAFIPGIRPGEQTAKYIDAITVRLTLVGSLYITFICLVPDLMKSSFGLPFNLGGTSMLIVVVVIMDFMAQVQSLLMSTQYGPALEKANLRNSGR
ncbi:preprotein translocase subunit SecY [Thorsellia anophelis]|uniref:Protein translocase subunit SecY n=1 Tax=Thorsellia anophelis DSM 18579 TaxID=1123402 RepID=A0A1H9YBM8_9GAMM|nr:preprotein translocase subunit SecY [Thorsellia anophelis]SES66321.1 protein translocase subunit secY/sec61 alpha [Thorsellia anophelis DSM 18579]